MTTHSRPRVIRRLTMISLAVGALILAGCGGTDEARQTAAAASGATSPGAAVDEFIAVAGKPGPQGKNLSEACKRISPAVRPGLRFMETVKPDDRNCAAALGLLLYYAGDTGDVPEPTGFTGKAGAVNAHDNQAFVSVKLAYQGAPDSHSPVPPGDFMVKVLTVREAGQWWVATPYAFDLRNASEPLAEDALIAQYQESLAEASKAGGQNEAGMKASSALGDHATPCPRGGASAARDAPGDVRLAQDSSLAAQQRPSDDLVEVIHSSDGDSACFSLRFAGEPPARGSVELAIRPKPDRDRVDVQWDAGQVVGQRIDGNENPAAVRVDAALDGSSLVIRVPARELGITSPTYRWAVKVFVPTDAEQVTHLDSVPDDLTITGEQDQYIRHGG